MSDNEKLKEPSEEFKCALVYSRTSILLCEHCGRVLFNPSSGLDFDEDYMEELIANSEADPDKFIMLNDDDEVQWGDLDGRQTPISCPCHSARKFEDWIWGHRFVIVDYLENRVARMKQLYALEQKNVDRLDPKKLYEEGNHEGSD